MDDATNQLLVETAAVEYERRPRSRPQRSRTVIDTDEIHPHDVSKQLPSPSVIDIRELRDWSGENPKQVA